MSEDLLAELREFAERRGPASEAGEIATDAADEIARLTAENETRRIGAENDSQAWSRAMARIDELEAAAELDQQRVDWSRRAEYNERARALAAEAKVAAVAALLTDPKYDDDPAVECTLIRAALRDQADPGNRWAATNGHTWTIDGTCYQCGSHKGCPGDTSDGTEDTIERATLPHLQR
jgi:hypothetical protein